MSNTDQAQYPDLRDRIALMPTTGWTQIHQGLKIVHLEEQDMRQALEWEQPPKLILESLGSTTYGRYTPGQMQIALSRALANEYQHLQNERHDIRRLQGAADPWDDARRRAAMRKRGRAAFTMDDFRRLGKEDRLLDLHLLIEVVILHLSVHYLKNQRHIEGAEDEGWRFEDEAFGKTVSGPAVQVHSHRASGGGAIRVGRVAPRYTD